MALIRVLDVETTGLGPEAEVCEVGFCDLVMGTVNAVDRAGSCLVRTGMPMPPEAQAVHHISDEDLAEYGLDFPVAWAMMLKGGYGSPVRPWEDMAADHLQVDVYAAHNANFERRFIGVQWTGKVPWVDTWRCAMRIWDVPQFDNQYLRYALGLAADPTRAAPTHAAAPDAYVTALLLAEMLKKHALPDLIAWSAEPPQFPRLFFGKHKGEKWPAVPVDYLRWMVRTADGGDNPEWPIWQELANREIRRRQSRATSAAVRT